MGSYSLTPKYPSEDEDAIVRRRDDALRRALNTPPTHRPAPKKSASKKAAVPALPPSKESLCGLLRRARLNEVPGSRSRLPSAPLIALAVRVSSFTPKPERLLRRKSNSARYLPRWASLTW